MRGRSRSSSPRSCASPGSRTWSSSPCSPTGPTPSARSASGPGRRVVLTGHMDTKPVSHGWSVTEPFSGDLIDGAVYGHGVMDMKAALACQIVAIEAVRASGLPLVGHARDGRRLRPHGRAARLDRLLRRAPRRTCACWASSPTTRCAWGTGAATTSTSRRSGARRTPATSRAAINANVLAAQAVLALDASKYEPELEPWVVGAVRRRDLRRPGTDLRGAAPGGPSMIPDECVIRVDCRPQPGVTIEQVRAEIDRCLCEARQADARFARRGRARRREERLPGRARATRSSG